MRIELRQNANEVLILLHNPRAIGEALHQLVPERLRCAATGDDALFGVLGAFYACMMGADRIAALDHLMRLNNVAEASLGDGTADAMAFNRNRTVLGMTLVGTMHEVRVALRNLCSTGIAADPRVREPWRPLNDLLAQLEAEDLAPDLRNSFAFHLGYPHEYARGIRAIESESVAVFQSAGASHHGGWRPAPWDALFNALEREKTGSVEAFSHLTVRTQTAHNGFSPMLLDFFLAVAEIAAVPIERT